MDCTRPFYESSLTARRHSGHGVQPRESTLFLFGSRRNCTPFRRICSHTWLPRRSRCVIDFAFGILTSVCRAWQRKITESSGRSERWSYYRTSAKAVLYDQTESGCFMLASSHSDVINSDWLSPKIRPPKQ